MDFAALPPEINSGRMYSGSGPGSMLAAAGAWDALAAELGSAASSYDAQIAGLTGWAWSGPSSAAMATAAEPYVAWMSRTAAQAHLAATQARAAVAAYETAFAGTVPPPVVTANRSLLASLVATNFLGVNTPAIAATEFHYGEMWAQDAAAMYGYAGASSTATQLTAFTEPPQTTNQGGLAAQSGAVTQAGADSAGSTAQSALSQLISLVPNSLQNLATSVTSTSSSAAAPGLPSMMSSISTIASNLTGAYSPVGIAAIPGGWWLTAMQALGLAQNGPGISSLLAGPEPITGALGPLSGGYMSLQTPTLTSAGLGGGSVSGAMGRAGMIGQLSVPTSWASAAPAVRTAAMTMPATGLAATPAIAGGSQSGLFTEMALSSLAGRALGGTTARSVTGAGNRVIGSAAAVAEDVAPEVNIIVIPADE